MAQFSQLNAGVKFAGVSIGHDTARIGVTIERGFIDLLRADDLFANRRLTGKVVLGRLDDADGQQTIPDLYIEVGGSFDVKGFRVSREKISLGLSFALAEINVAELAMFSNGSGRLVVDAAADIPDEESDVDDADDGPADAA